MSRRQGLTNRHHLKNFNKNYKPLRSEINSVTTQKWIQQFMTVLQLNENQVNYVDEGP